MKNLTLCFLICISCFLLHSQNHQRDVLYYSDTLARGEFKRFGDARVHFYPNGANKKIKIHNQKVDSLLTTDKEGNTKTHFRVLLKTSKGKPYIVVKNCLVKGVMSLFDSESFGTNPLPQAGMGGFGGGAGAFGSFGGTPAYSYTLYLVTPASFFAQKKIVTPRFKRKKFIPWVKQQFAACPKVLQAIEIPEHSEIEKRLTRYVTLYNKHCAPKP